MNKFLEVVMNFINENTTLLIIICVFLIFVLIGYLIDNSIKTRKMEKQLTMETPNEDSTKAEEVKPEEVAVPLEEEKPKVEEEKVDIEEEKDSVKEDSEVTLEEVKEDSMPVAMENVEETVSEESSVESTNKIDDLLLRDFTKENEDLEKTREIKEEITLNPVSEVVSIEDYEKNEIEPVVEETKEEKSLYKNDKKLSDIFKKKEDKPILETTTDYSNELDRILKKLNDTKTDDSTLEETTDFTNMF